MENMNQEPSNPVTSTRTEDTSFYKAWVKAFGVPKLDESEVGKIFITTSPKRKEKTNDSKK